MGAAGCIFFKALVHINSSSICIFFCLQPVSVETGHNVRKLGGITMTHIPQNCIIFRLPDLVHNHAATDTIRCLYLLAPLSVED